MIGLTPALEDAIIEAIGNGVPASTAAVAAGIPAVTVRSWIAAAERGTWADGTPLSEDAKASLSGFSARIARAQAECEALRVQRIAAAGASVGKSGIPEWRADAWLLNNHPRYRQTYREEKQLKVEQSGTISHEHRQVRELSDDQLLLEAPADLAILIEGPRAESDQEVISGQE